MKNERIRAAAKETGVRFWEIAERVGITDSNFSRKLRRELPESERDRLLAIIEAIAAEKRGGTTHDAENADIV